MLEIIFAIGVLAAGLGLLLRVEKLEEKVRILESMHE